MKINEHRYTPYSLNKKYSNTSFSSSKNKDHKKAAGISSTPRTTKTVMKPNNTKTLFSNTSTIINEIETNDKSIDLTDTNEKKNSNKFIFNSYGSTCAPENTIQTSFESFSTAITSSFSTSTTNSSMKESMVTYNNYNKTLA